MGCKTRRALEEAGASALESLTDHPQRRERLRHVVEPMKDCTLRACCSLCSFPEATLTQHKEKGQTKKRIPNWGAVLA